MSTMSYISFPRKLPRHQTSYFKLRGEDAFHINKIADDSWDYKTLPIIEDQVDGRVSIWDILYNALFDNCFVNPFIYEFGICIPDYYYKQKIAIIESYYLEKETTGRNLDHDAKDHELSEYWNKEWSLRNQVLHKYLSDNLNTGEFVEIYTSWIEEEDENGMHFGPPTSETVINLKELLCLPFSEESIDFGERKKLTIHKI